MIYAPPRIASNTTSSDFGYARPALHPSSSLTITPEPDSWVEYAQFRIKQAFALEDNWDREGALQVQAVSIDIAEALAIQFVGMGIARPFVLPTQDGGIGFEWLTSSVEISIVINGDHVHAYLLDRESKDEKSGPLEDLWDLVYEALAEID